MLAQCGNCIFMATSLESGTTIQSCVVDAPQMIGVIGNVSAMQADPDYPFATSAAWPVLLGPTQLCGKFVGTDGGKTATTWPSQSSIKTPAIVR